MSDDLLSPAEADALIAKLRVVIDAPRDTWDAMTAGEHARKMQSRTRAMTDRQGERARVGGATDFIPVRTISDISDRMNPGSHRMRATRARAKAKRESPLDPVARPLLIEARAYSVSLRVSDSVHAGVGA